MFAGTPVGRLHCRDAHRQRKVAPDEGAARVNDEGVAATNVGVYLAESPEKNPDASALVCDDTTTSHSALGNSAAVC